MADNKTKEKEKTAKIPRSRQIPRYKHLNKALELQEPNGWIEPFMERFHRNEPDVESTLRNSPIPTVNPNNPMTTPYKQWPGMKMVTQNKRKTILTHG